MLFSKEKIRRMMDREYKNVWKKLLEIVEENGERLLDIGCGDGRLTVKFAKRISAKEVYGIDIDKTNISKARKRGIKAIYADANKILPFPSKYFDVILCNQVVEHLINPDNLFKEIRRLLKDNGCAYISVPNLCSFHNRIFILLGWQPTTIPPSNKFVFGNPLRGQKVMFGGGTRHMNAFPHLL